MSQSQKRLSMQTRQSAGSHQEKESLVIAGQFCACPFFCYLFAVAGWSLTSREHLDYFIWNEIGRNAFHSHAKSQRISLIFLLSNDWWDNIWHSTHRVRKTTLDVRKLFSLCGSLFVFWAIGNESSLEKLRAEVHQHLHGEYFRPFSILKLSVLPSCLKIKSANCSLLSRMMYGMLVFTLVHATSFVLAFIAFEHFRLKKKTLLYGLVNPDKIEIYWSGTDWLKFLSKVKRWRYRLVFTYLSLFEFQEGETVLISAARDGHLEVVRTLLSKYADIEASDCVSVCVFFFFFLSLF